MEEKDFLKEENERLTNQINMLKLQLNGYEQCIQQMKGSFSWRLTKPLRWCKENCTPLREGIYFIKEIKNKGLRKGIQHSLINYAANKHPYRSGLFSFEYQNQIKSRELFSTKYHIIVCMYKEYQILLDKMFDAIMKQSILPAEIIILTENTDSDIETIIGKYQLKNHMDIKKMGYQQLIKESQNIKDTDQIILMSPDVCMTQDCIYEVEMQQQNNMSDILYCDDAIEISGNKYEYRYKPDYAPHYLQSENYVGNWICIRAEIWKNMIQQNEFENWEQRSIMYDILLYAQKDWNISHISKILFAMKPVSNEHQEREYYSRKHYWLNNGENYLIKEGIVNGTSHIIYANSEKQPLVSILIPNYDHVEDLKKCLHSIKEKSSYSNMEIIIIENNSKEQETFSYYEQIQKEGIKVLYWKDEFNYSAINNFAVQYAKGEYILLLNNDVEVLTPNWIEEMLTYARKPEVAAVGAKLLFPDNTIQHAGVILGIRHLAGHAFRGLPEEESGYLHRTKVVQDYSVVTAACLLIQKNKFLQCGGFDENLAVDFNDVDFCMKLRKLGYYNVYTPFSQLYHYESKSRGDNLSPEKRARNEREFYYFNTKWYQEILNGDPFYNKNLTLLDDSFSFRKKKEIL